MKPEQLNEKNESIQPAVDTNIIPYSTIGKGLHEIDELDIDEGISDWPILDNKALHGLAGEFVELATENSEADPNAVLATFLARFAVEVGTGPYFMVGDSKHHARTNVAIAGASSKARKGTSAKPVDSFFDLREIIDAKTETDQSYSSIVLAKGTPGPLSSGEGLVHAVRDPSEEYKINPRTGEGKLIETDPGVQDKRLYVLDEEFASALSCTKREGNTLSAIIRTAWDSGNIEPLTKTNKTKTTGAHVGIVTHITIEELHAKLNETEAFNGFANRFCWVAARRKKLVPLPKPMDPIKLFTVKEKLLKAIRSAKNLRRIERSPETEKLWIERYPTITEGRPGLLGSILARAEAQITRIALIYALLDGTATKEPVHLEAALAFWKYCEDSATFIFGNRCENPIAERIYKALKMRGPLSKTDLYCVTGKNRSRRQLDEALKGLIAQNKIEQTKEGLGRKQKYMFAIPKKR